jgi:hypothetical protein
MGSRLKLMLVRSFSTTSRPALRAAASGGRPRAGNDPTGTEAVHRGSGQRPDQRPVCPRTQPSKHLTHATLAAQQDDQPQARLAAASVDQLDLELVAVSPAFYIMLRIGPEDTCG